MVLFVVLVVLAAGYSGSKQSAAPTINAEAPSFADQVAVVGVAAAIAVRGGADVDGYTVHVRFEDGTAADVDLSYLAEHGGVFEPVRDPAYFRRLRADREAGTIVWPNAADIAPETLYAHAQRRAAATA